MREQRLLQRHRPLRRRRRPGFFRVECPDQLWHLDMTSVWVAEHGWCYLNAAIDCCTREIVGWSLELRCRTEEATSLADGAVAARGIEPGSLTLGTDNGAAFTNRGFRARRSEFETLDQARRELAAYIDSYHHRPHSGLGYRTPTEVRRTWGGWTATTENSGLKCRARRGSGHDVPSRRAIVWSSMIPLPHSIGGSATFPAYFGSNRTLQLVGGDAKIFVL
jgi:transposase InsO family protein